MPLSRLMLWLPHLPSIFPRIRDFSIEAPVHIRWPKYCSFSLKISPFNEDSMLSSLKIDWFDLAVQGTLRSLLQHYSLKASVAWHSAFFTVELWQLSVTTGKTTALSIERFVGRVMFLLFNTLSRFVIAFLLKSNHLLISWLQSPSTVILESKKKSVTTSTPFPLLFVMKQWGRMPCS